MYSPTADDTRRIVAALRTRARQLRAEAGGNKWIGPRFMNTRAAIRAEAGEMAALADRIDPQGNVII